MTARTSPRAMIDPSTFTRWWTILADRYGKVFADETSAVLYELASERLTTAQFVAGCREWLVSGSFFPNVAELVAAAKPAPELIRHTEDQRRRAEQQQLDREAEWRRARDDTFARWGAANPDEFAQLSAAAWLSLYEERAMALPAPRGADWEPMQATPFTRVLHQAKLAELLTVRLHWIDCAIWIERRYSGRRAS